ncbi:hypothetical protein CC80DRAFT_427337 [Byssothecium circinans]|uniref:Uncharacterized protein n=1 Tax=Byssothecium circinans TaxID=147558 RepID=A0A6A5TF88_9PLEO|nr:hypothetical protein CC80DRAFT_427337 [Byssothecium circinans]
MTSPPHHSPSPNTPTPTPTQRSNSPTPNLTYADIRITRALLQTLGLPTELVLTILSYASYTPTLHFKATHLRIASADTTPAIAAQLSLSADVLTLRTLQALKATKVRTRVREIEFVIRSRDQGWTTQRGVEGTFNTSSWLEASILRPLEGVGRAGAETGYDWTALFSARRTVADFKQAVGSRGEGFVERVGEGARGPQEGEEPLAWYLQAARVGDRNPEPYRVVWRADGSEGNEGAGKGVGFVEALREGDKVLVWARAKYPGWQCIVDNLEMTVRYGFDE